MTVICITGMPGAGKGEVVDILKEEANLPVVRMGDMVWDEVRSRGLPLEPQVVGEIANSERQAHGNDIWAHRCVAKVKEKLSGGNTHIIIDGVRTRQEIAVFKSAFKDSFYVIAVFASLSTRFDRIRARKRADDTNTRELFDQRDKRELSWGVGEVIALADGMIMNEGGLEELRAATLSEWAKIKRDR
jgi:dephospho-CoA kinase